jgi:hypothetical protein
MRHENTRKAVRALLFCVAVVCCHLLLRFLYVHEVMPRVFPVKHDRVFLRNLETMKIGLLGNSHTFLSLHASIIPDSLNFGSLGEGYMVTYYKLKRILDREPDAFAVVILQVDLHSFSGGEFHQGKNYRWAQFIDYYDLASFSGDYIQHGREWIQYREFPYAGSAKDLAHAVSGPQGQEPDVGDTPLLRDFSTVEDPERKAWSRAANHFKGQNWYDDRVAHYFGRILDLCEAHNIHVVLVEFPVTEEYLAQAQTFLPLEEWRARVAAAIEGRPGITHLRLRDLYFGQNQLFGDPDHLNAEGGVLFSTHVRDEMAQRGLL